MALAASFVFSSWISAGPLFTILFIVLLIRVLLKLCAEESSLRIFIDALFAFAGVLAVISVIVSIITVPYYAWSAIRTAWSTGILRGYDFYYGNSGLAIARMYGPISPLIYLLSASLNNFAASIHAGSFISMLLYFVPVALIFKRCVKFQQQAPLLFMAYMSIFVLLTFISLSLKRSAFTVHADAPSLGFGALACLIFVKREHLTIKDLAISSIFVTLAFWSKQTAVPLAIVLPAYVLIFYGNKAFKGYFSFLILAGVISTLIFGLIFDFNKLFFEMFFIPLRQPSKFFGGWFNGAIASIPSLVDAVWVEIILAILLFAIYAILERAKENDSVLIWRKEKPWLLFFIVGVFMVPVSLLGRMKVGGDVNALSPTAFYWSIAVAIVFIDLYRLSLTKNIPVKKSILCFFAVMLLFVLNIATFGINQDLRNIASSSPYKISNQVSKFISKHRGEAYFPYHNLEHLLIEGRAYHTLDGLMDLYFSRIPVGKDRLYAFLPANMKFIAIEKSFLQFIRFDSFLQKWKWYFPSFNKSIFFADLPDFEVFVQEKTYYEYLFKLRGFRDRKYDLKQ